MEAGVYTVPSEIVFKNYSTTTGPQIRNLLVKNTTNQALHTVISYPFSPSFRVSAPADLRAELKPSPFHLVLELPPKSTSKVIVELKPSEPSSSPAGVGQHLHDVLVVLAGGVCALRVPVRAVPSGVEPATGSAQAWWPPQKELNVHCNNFIEKVKAMYDVLSAPQPPTEIVASMASVPDVTAARSATASVAATASGVARELSGASGTAGGELPPAVGTALAPAQLRPGSVSSATKAAVAPPTVLATATAAAAAARPLPELPPEGFSQPQDLYDNAADVMYDDDGDSVQQQTYILHKSVKVQGRVAVAMPLEGSGGPPAVRGPAASGQLSLPAGDAISRSCSTSSLTTAATLGSGSLPGSASPGRLAFALNGKLYDARGNPLDPTLELLSAAGGLAVVDCGDGATTVAAAAAAASPIPLPQQPQHASRPSGSGLAITPPRLSTPSQGTVVGGTPTTTAAATGGGAGLSPGPGAGRVSLTPLKYGNMPVTASLRPGSAASSSVSTHLSRAPPPPPPPYTGQGGPSAVAMAGAAAAAPPSAAGPSADEDPLRKAALAAALRELGITDLPAPSPRGTTSSGQGPSSAVSVTAIPASAALPSYLQYGLPPNYRPSSGRRRPPSTTGSAAAYDSGSDDVMDDHDDADLEAKLVQQIESNVLKATGPAPAPAPKGRMGCGSASSPGSYLPPRAGAASSGGLGAPSAAAANAAAVAAGSRLGKAAAAAAAASGGGSAAARRLVAQSSDDDYLEESEFEMRLQRQIDSDVANGGGLAPGRGGGCGGGASWRGSSGACSGGRSAAVPRLSGPAGDASKPGAAPGGIKRSSSGSSRGTATATAAVPAAGGPRRASADAGLPMEKVMAATRGGSGSGARPQASGTGNGAAGPRSAAPKPAGATEGTKPGAVGTGTGTSSKSTAGKAGTAVAAGGPGAQRMKANWDALG